MRGRTAIFRGLAALIVAAPLALLAPTAAIGENVHSRLTIKLKREIAPGEDGQDTLLGTVRSRARACESNRRMKLYHRSVRHTSEDKSRVIATFRTSSRGKWRHGQLKNANGEDYAPPGYYRVKATETNKGGVTCKDRFSFGVLVP